MAVVPAESGVGTIRPRFGGPARRVHRTNQQACQEPLEHHVSSFLGQHAYRGCND